MMIILAGMIPVQVMAQGFAHGGQEYLCAGYPIERCPPFCGGYCQIKTCAIESPHAQSTASMVNQTYWWTTDRLKLPLSFQIPDDSCRYAGGEIGPIQNLPVAYSDGIFAIQSEVIPHDNFILTYPKCRISSRTVPNTPCPPPPTTTTTTGSTTTNTGSTTTTSTSTTTTTIDVSRISMCTGTQCYQVEKGTKCFGNDPSPCDTDGGCTCCLIDGATLTDAQPNYAKINSIVKAGEHYESCGCMAPYSRYSLGQGGTNQIPHQPGDAWWDEYNCH